MESRTKRELIVGLKCTSFPLLCCESGGCSFKLEMKEDWSRDNVGAVTLLAG